MIPASEQVAKYGAWGLKLLAYPKGLKGPREKNWQASAKTDFVWDGESNVGAMMGERGSNGLYIVDGDFDWPGIAIGNLVMRVFGATPWRFSALDYSAAVAGGRPLGAAMVAAEWDASLAHAMQAGGCAIDEESVAAPLLQDLARKALANDTSSLL